MLSSLLYSFAKTGRGRKEGTEAFNNSSKKPKGISMANFYSWAFLVICATLLVTSSSPTVDAGGGNHHHLGLGMGWIPSKSPCKGSIAECMGGDEFELDSEINRRILATNQYISYGALQRNTVPCSRRGASYYNCRPGAQANPYNRGCSAITRCRS